jgi:hypothetical protein
VTYSTARALASRPLDRWECLLLSQRDGLVDEACVLAELRKAVNTHWGKWIAARAGVHPSFVTLVLTGRKRMSPALARVLGYERVGGTHSHVYRRIGS